MVIPFYDATTRPREPVDAALVVDAERLFVVVAAHDTTGGSSDSVEWEFLGRP